MRVSKRLYSPGVIATFLALCGATAVVHAQQPTFNTDPLLPENSAVRVSEHVYVIMGFPNVGIIVGNNATLVVDTGLGPRNGATVARQAKKLSKGKKLYLTTTHFHPEHAGGDGGFPPDTILIRDRVQQQEIEQDGKGFIERFRQIARFAPFLDGDITFRQPNMLFDTQHKLDLGGVHVTLMWLGPAHTKGDEEILVEEDRTLLTGDLAMKDRPPQNYAAGSNAQAWIQILDKLAALKPLHVVPDHGDLGDSSLISDQRATMSAAAKE